MTKPRPCFWHRRWVFVRLEGRDWEKWRCVKCGTTELRRRK